MVFQDEPGKPLPTSQRMLTTEAWTALHGAVKAMGALRQG
jgi:hypothetical protein